MGAKFLPKLVSLVKKQNKFYHQIHGKFGQGQDKTFSLKKKSDMFTMVFDFLLWFNSRSDSKFSPWKRNIKHQAGLASVTSKVVESCTNPWH